MAYCPNREKPVLLECGCVDIPWCNIETIGEIWLKGPMKGRRIRRLFCKRHPLPGGQAILGKATPKDMVAYDDSTRQGTLGGCEKESEAASQETT
jgi:hypothetical protein